MRRGDGFDNNSDTLTISPVLIEQLFGRRLEKAVSAAFVPQKDALNPNLPVPVTASTNHPKNFRRILHNRQAKIRINVEAFPAWRLAPPARPAAEADGIMEFPAALSFASRRRGFWTK